MQSYNNSLTALICFTDYHSNNYQLSANTSDAKNTLFWPQETRNMPYEAPLGMKISLRLIKPLDLFSGIVSVYEIIKNEFKLQLKFDGNTVR